VILAIAVIVMIAGFVGKVMLARNTSGGTIADSVGSVVGSAMKGDVAGEVGKAYLTQWFNFSVLSIGRVEEYAGYEPEEGNVLIDVVIAELCTFDEPIDMGTSDFYVDADSFLEYVYPIDPLDGTMMPENFKLAPKEKKEYHMVYEVPEGAEGLKLVYTEIDASGGEGATFTIDIEDAGEKTA
jgi:uncharacterized membrane protein YeaQ/YmgE (transglycosylase-associated protein family)